ncbi:ComEC/Rec2 family competence protein [Geodermatophilus obscurus]|uniref:ComEC/Rec2 family competence protein n=1 Tax=Geodermatophilus obscurus TaxID=1861 RepID=UPI0015A621F4|nr:MBL fold metallo-hydrolase [Geodermatophilus obscurus]
MARTRPSSVPATAPAPLSLTTDVLPARQGDCLVLSWPDGTTTRRLLVDAGPAPAYEGIRRRLGRLDGDVDVLVLTHVDADHVEGVILLLNDRGLALGVGEVWYNGAPHLSPELGAVQGEILSAIITERAIPWNTTFGTGAVAATRDTGALPVRDLPGGLRLTVLAPDAPALLRLRDDWERACREAGIDVGSVADALAALDARPRLRPEDSYLDREPPPDVRTLARRRADPDRSVPNASSVVLLAERGDDRVLLAGDSTPGVLLPAVRRLLAERGADRLPLTEFKLPHHGSAKNLTADLVRLLPARRYLVSSDGSYFGHPDDAAIATVLEYGPPGLELVFNYDTPRNRRWDDPRLRARHRHTVRFPADEDGPG